MYIIIDIYLIRISENKMSALLKKKLLNHTNTVKHYIGII